MSIRFDDRASILLGDVKTTKDGYKVIRSKIARTGIQGYLGKEFEGQAASHGFSDEDLVRVYRDPADVFAKDAVNGWAGVPVTINHPDELVTPENVSRYQVGDVREKAYIDADTGWFGLEWMIRDAGAIAKFDSGEFAEVSGGYTAVIDWTPGVAADGQKYDAKQVGIVPNHLALVPRGRAFTDADKWGATPINLNDRKDSALDMVKLMVGDKAVQIAASDADVVTALVKDHTAAVTAKDTRIGELTAELADAKSKIFSDEAFEAKVAEAVEHRSRLEAVRAKFGDEAVKDATPAMIDGMFRVIDKAVAVDDSARAVFGDKKVLTSDAEIEARIKAAQRKFLNLEQK